MQNLTLYTQKHFYQVSSLLLCFATEHKQKR